MKTHDLAHTLEKISQILRASPNQELNSFLDMIASQLEKEGKDKKKAAARPQSTGLSEIEKNLSSLSPAEVEAYLKSEEEHLSTSQLAEIASKIGLPTSKRQSKSAIVNLITRHFEAGQMDALIRSPNKDKSRQTDQDAFGLPEKNTAPSSAPQNPITKR